MKATEALDGVLEVSIRPAEVLIDLYRAEEVAEEAQFRKEAEIKTIAPVVNTIIMPGTARLNLIGYAPTVHVSALETLKEYEPSQQVDEEDEEEKWMRIGYESETAAIAASKKGQLRTSQPRNKVVDIADFRAKKQSSNPVIPLPSREERGISALEAANSH